MYFTGFLEIKINLRYLYRYTFKSMFFQLVYTIWLNLQNISFPRKNKRSTFLYDYKLFVKHENKKVINYMLFYIFSHHSFWLLNLTDLATIYTCYHYNSKYLPHFQQLRFSVGTKPRQCNNCHFMHSLIPF